MDCFAARNDGGYTLAFSPRIAPEVCQKLPCPPKSEGAGNAGCALHPRSRAQCAQKVRARAYRAAESIRHSLRNGFTAYFVLSPENGSFASVACASYRTLSASTAAPEPHDFTVRLRRVRLARPSRPSHLTARS